MNDTICTDCGSVIGTNFVEVHRRWHNPSVAEPERSRLDELAKKLQEASLREFFVKRLNMPWRQLDESDREAFRYQVKAILKWLDEDAHQRYDDETNKSVAIFHGIDQALNAVLGFKANDYAEAAKPPRPDPVWIGFGPGQEG